MNYRLADVLASEAISAAATKTIPIVLTDVISRIVISVKAVNAAARATLLAHPAALVTKIELVDGSDVLFSLSGYEAQALNFYDNLKTVYSNISDGESEGQYTLFLMDFGRYLYDPELAFDPKKFNNPALKITYDRDACDTNAVSGTLEVRAYVFDEKVISPIGFLMNKQIETYTMVTTAYKYIHVPTDYAFRKLLVRAYLTNKSVDSQLDQFKLSEDNDKRIPIDVNGIDYMDVLASTYPKIHEEFALRVRTAATSVYVTPTHWPRAYVLGNVGTNAFGRRTYYEAERVGFACSADMDDPSFGEANGFIPHHTLCFPFGDQRDLADWYDVTRVGSLIARLKAATGATAVTTLFGQQLRNY